MEADFRGSERQYFIQKKEKKMSSASSIQMWELQSKFKWPKNKWSKNIMWRTGGSVN